MASASDTPLFVHLRSEWHFDELDDGCRLHFLLDLQLRSVLHDEALRHVLDRVAQQQVDAFKQRCDVLAPTLVSRPSAAASSTGSTAAAAPPSPAAWSFVQAEPAWRQRVDGAFDAHADGVGGLTLPRFVEACRALQVTDAAEATAAPLAALTGGGGDGGGGHGGETDREAGAVGGAHAAELRQAALAAWFVHFDEDASGRVDRNEFTRNLWLLTRATEDERMAYAFHKLDRAPRLRCHRHRPYAPARLRCATTC